MLAYVFWHWKRAGVETREYESCQRAFQRALNQAPPAGFLGSFGVFTSGASWAADGVEAYEDWYLLEDFGALGPIKEAAVSGIRAAPHNAVAGLAGGGVGGLYGLRRGEVSYRPRHALWFSKPEAMRYGKFFDQLSPVVDETRGALWLRQLVLSPAPEFCLHSEMPVVLPAMFVPKAMALQPVWPD